MHEKTRRTGHAQSPLCSAGAMAQHAEVASGVGTNSAVSASSSSTSTIHGTLSIYAQRMLLLDGRCGEAEAALA
jgi:hypothetical protein